MNPTHISLIAKELNITAKQVEATAALLAEDATVPFIARYRKEATGSLDEVAITSIRDRLGQLDELDKRREAILKSITDQGKMTDELQARIMAAETMTALEDLYLPYRPKRRTRATIAKERGLEPLAHLLWEQSAIDPLIEARVFVDPEKEVQSEADALAGARDIMAEWVTKMCRRGKAYANCISLKVCSTHKSSLAKRPKGVSSRTILTGRSRWRRLHLIECWRCGVGRRRNFLLCVRAFRRRSHRIANPSLRKSQKRRCRAGRNGRTGWL